MRERRMRKIVRNLPPPQRKFALALKHVLRKNHETPENRGSDVSKIHFVSSEIPRLRGYGWRGVRLRNGSAAIASPPQYQTRKDPK